MENIKDNNNYEQFDFENLYYNNIVSPQSESNSTNNNSINEIIDNFIAPQANNTLRQYTSPYLDNNSICQQSPYQSITSPSFLDWYDDGYLDSRESQKTPQQLTTLDSQHFELEKYDQQLHQCHRQLPEHQQTLSLVQNTENSEYANTISRFEVETENFMIHLLQSSLNENISTLNKIKDELLAFSNESFGVNDDLKIMQLITKINTNNSDQLYQFKIFFNNSESSNKKAQSYLINSLGYGLLMCLLHLNYLKNIQNFTHRLRIDINGLIFRRFTLFCTKNENAASTSNGMTITASKREITKFCNTLKKEFNLKRDIIICMQKHNYNRFMLHTIEQFDLATLNYMKIKTKYLLKDLSSKQHKYKVIENSWFLPLSLKSTPCWIYKCDQENIEGEEYIQDFVEYSNNCKIDDHLYILSIQSMFACSVIDILNSKNCLTMMTVNINNIPERSYTENKIETCIKGKFCIYASSTQSTGKKTNQFIPDMKSKTSISKLFFGVFEHFIDIHFANEENKYNIRILWKFFLKVGSFKYKKSTDMDLGGSEFYDIYFSTKIIYNMPLIEMFDIRDIEMTTKQSKLSILKDGEIFDFNDIDDIDLTVSAKDEFKKIMDNTNPVFTREHENQFELITEICQYGAINWKKICISLKNLLIKEDPYSLDCIVVLYFFYCSRNKLTPKISKESFRISCQVLQDIHPVFPLSQYINYVNKHFNICFGENEPYEMLKHILTLLIKNGHVTFVVGLLMRLDVIIEKMKLQRIIIYCIDLLKDILENYEKYILLSMMHITETNSDENISLAIKCCFFPNIILYFLCDFHPDTEFTTRVTYFIDFMCGNINEFFLEEDIITRNGVSDNDFDNDVDEDNELVLGGNKRKRKTKKHKKASQYEVKKKKYEKITEKYAGLTLPIQSIISRYIGFCFKKSAITYAYDKFFYRDMSELSLGEHNFGIEYTIVEPSHNAYWYRRRPGIYNSYTRAFEKHSPALFGVISLENPIWIPNDYDFNSFDYKLKNKLFDTTLKAVHFLKVCSYNKLMAVMLGPIQDPNQTTGPLADFYPIKTTQVLFSDLYSTQDCLPNGFFCLVNKEHKELNYIVLWFYLIICELSKSIPDINYFITHPNIFISQMYMGIERHIYGNEKDNHKNNKQENDETINADILNMGRGEESPHDYEEIDRMWNTANIQTTMDIQMTQNSNINNTPTTDSQNILDAYSIVQSETSFKSYNMQIFNQVLKKTPKLEIINDRRLWNDIEINGGEVLKMFLIQIVSWFIRMDVFHPYNNTEFFKYINTNRFVSI